MLTYYETHLTVELNNNSMEDFRRVCEIIDAKAIVINLKETKQVMTAKTVKSILNDVYEQAKQDVIVLEENGFKVVRVKIETDKVSKETKYSYAEIHLLCHTRKLIEYPNILNELPLFDSEGNQIKGHISRNEFKPNVTFITWRSKFIEDFNYFHSVHGGLLELGVLFNPLDKIELEIAVYDSNEELDSEWIKD